MILTAGSIVKEVEHVGQPCGSLAEGDSWSGLAEKEKPPAFFPATIRACPSCVVDEVVGGFRGRVTTKVCVVVRRPARPRLKRMPKNCPKAKLKLTRSLPIFVLACVALFFQTRSRGAGRKPSKLACVEKAAGETRRGSPTNTARQWLDSDWKCGHR